MNFFKKMLRSILGRSNSDDPFNRPQPPTTGLSIIYQSAIIQTPPNVLHSPSPLITPVIIQPPPVPDVVQPINEDSSGLPSVTGDDDHASTASDIPRNEMPTTGGDASTSGAGTSGTSRPVWDRLLAGGVPNPFDRCTETLGLESTTEWTDSTEVLEASSKAGCRSRMKMARKKKSEKGERKVFPPFMSSLNKNGRPRYSLRRERKNGRLKIDMVWKNRVVWHRRKDGRLVCIDQDDDYEEDDEEEEQEEGEETPSAENGNNEDDDTRGGGEGMLFAGGGGASVMIQ